MRTEKIADGVIPEIPDVSLAALGVTATAEELNYVDGVISNVQSQLDSKANMAHTHVVSDVSGLQDSIDAKANISHTHDAGDLASGTLLIDRIPTITDDKIASVSAEKITGTIPSEILPSYVDDVIEVENYPSLPPTGESGKIYVDKQTNKTYRWGGSEYVEISASLALGETSSTAFRGDYGKTAYQHAQSKGSEFATGFYKISTNAEGHVISATPIAKGDITALGIPGEDTNTTYEDATTSTSGLMSASDKTKLDGIESGANKLPAGGTEGQVLTKTVDGEAWQDAPEADLTGYVKTDTGGRVTNAGSLSKFLVGPEDNTVGITAGSNGGTFSTLYVGTSGEHGVQIMSAPNIETSSIYVGKMVADEYIGLHASRNARQFLFDSKSVTSITDAISSTDRT